MFVQLWDSMFYKSNVLIAQHFHLIVALCLYLFTYFFHMTKNCIYLVKVLLFLHFLSFLNEKV